MLHECKVSCLWAEQTKGHEKGSKLSALQMKDNIVLVRFRGLYKFELYKSLRRGEGEGEGGCLLLA